MSDGSLSQDEIDALLAGGGGMDLGAEPEPVPAPSSMSSANVQGLISLLSGLTGSLSSNLSGMLGKNVEVGAQVMKGFLDTLVSSGMREEKGLMAQVRLVREEDAAAV